ncbi:MAG: UbiA family prenyltransferase, partial [Fidelibacterota bacterium]
ITTLNTLIGSVPGALPPVGGWVSVTGSIDTPAWILFGILFCWQIPHFLSIAFMYAADYRKGGFKMLPGEYPNGWETRYMIFFFTLIMPVIAFGLYLVESTGLFFAAGSALTGLSFLILVVKNMHFRERRNALTIMFGSIIYLPALLIIILLDVMI